MTAKKQPAKKAPEKKGPGGRPKAVIDGDLVEKLASIGCTDKEIAMAANTSIDTLGRRFAERMEKGRENGKTRLRKKQLEVAMTGNVTMLIWLGKQMLNQAEKVEAQTHHTGEVGGTLSPEDAEAVKTWAANIRTNIRKQRTKR